MRKYGDGGSIEDIVTEFLEVNKLTADQIVPGSETAEKASDFVLKAIGAGSDTELRAYEVNYINSRERRRAKELSLEDMYVLCNPRLKSLSHLCRREINRLINYTHLTGRQAQCLRAKLAGESYKRISKEFHLDESTVRRHVSTAVKKLCDCDDIGVLTVILETFGYEGVQIILFD